MKQKHRKVSVFNKTSETIRDDTFYTTDTEAYLIFELIDEDFIPDSATVTVYNVYGKATINASVEVADGIVQYEMPADAIGHPGGWRTQVIYTKDNEDYTTGIINFDVGGHLLDNKKPAIVDIENWNSFIAHARELIDDWEQLEEIRQANEQQRELAESARQNEFETNETERQSEFETNETSRQANELVREEAENNRQSTFEANEVGRQSEFETAEANRVAFFETAEVNRAIAETNRASAEIGRVSAEQIRVNAETIRAEFYEGFESEIANIKTEIEKKANKQQEDWITPTLLNGWEANISNQTPRYYKDEFGVVHLEGCVKSGVDGSDMFIFPEGYKPFGIQRFAASTGNTTVGRVDVRNGGAVSPNKGASNYVYLSGISFKAEV